MHILALLCKVGWRQDTWVYDPEICDQTYTCPQCGKQRSREQHDVRVWKSDGFFTNTMSGLCVRSKQGQSRQKPPLVEVDPVAGMDSNQEQDHRKRQPGPRPRGALHAKLTGW